MKANKRVRDLGCRPRLDFRAVAVCPTDEIARNVTTWPYLAFGKSQASGDFQVKHPNICEVAR